MAIRMGPRLAYTLELPPELATLPVPALLLQPLVENSIQHGLEPKVRAAASTVARASRRPLCWKCGHRRRHGARRGGKGFGLAQVRERLRRAVRRAAS
jgi:LytS/YehU family sensor histidine kinase